MQTNMADDALDWVVFKGEELCDDICLKNFTFVQRKIFFGLRSKWQAVGEAVFHM